MNNRSDPNIAIIGAGITGLTAAFELSRRGFAVDVYEALAYTVPGIVAHESALKGGERLTIPQLDPA